MSCDKIDVGKIIDDAENLSKRTYDLALGRFIGQFIGELIDKLRAEEEARSELENKLIELEKRLDTVLMRSKRKEAE